MKKFNTFVQIMNYPAASRRGITEELVLQFASSSGELTPMRLETVEEYQVVSSSTATVPNNKNLIKKPLKIAYKGLSCGLDGTRTRDLLRDRQAF